jgi:hypothetical protein
MEIIIHQSHVYPRFLGNLPNGGSFVTLPKKNLLCGLFYFILGIRAELLFFSGMHKGRTEPVFKQTFKHLLLPTA